MEEKNKKNYIGTSFNKAMKIPSLKEEKRTPDPFYANVKLSPSSQKILDSFDDELIKDDLIKEYDDFVAMKQGDTKVGYSTPLTININDYKDLKEQTTYLQQKERANKHILDKRGREFYMKQLRSENAHMYSIKPSSKPVDLPDDVFVKNAEEKLTLLDKKILMYERFPEIMEFNKNAAACQVHATQGLQIFHNQALKALPCVDKGEKYISDLKEDDVDIVEEGKLKMAEADKKLSLLLLLKDQIEESDLRKKITWENKQKEASDNTRLDFETSILAMNDLKTEAKEKELFRKDLKNMIQYSKDLKKYKAMENKLLLKRDNNFNEAKEEFIRKCTLQKRSLNSEQALKNLIVFSHTKDILDAKFRKEEEHNEWVMWDAEKKLKQKEDKKTCKEEKLAMRDAILKEREYLKKFKDQQNKELATLEMDEHKRNLKWMEFNDKLQSAEPLSRNILKDTVRFIVLDQINENELKKINIQEAKLLEGTRRKNYEEAYKNLIRSRQLQKLAEHKENGMPLAYIGHLKRKFKLDDN